MDAILIDWGSAEPDDDRRTCVACVRYTPGSCADHRNALLATPQISRALAVLPQRCPAFTSTTSEG